MKKPVYNPSWNAEVMALYRHDMQEIWDPGIAIHIWNQYHNQLDIYLAIAEGTSKRILDIGCAQGTLALMLAEYGHHVTAVDIRQSFLDYAASRHERGDIRFIRADILELALAERFDLIYANQVIEHLTHPLEFLQKLRGMLNPGGKLVVTTPNGQYLRNSLPSYSEMGDLADYSHLRNSADADGHFFAYTASELVRLLEVAGFVKPSVTCFESPWISGHMKLRYIHGIVPASVFKLLDRALLSVPWIGTRMAHQLLVQGVLT